MNALGMSSAKIFRLIVESILQELKFSPNVILKFEEF